MKIFFFISALVFVGCSSGYESAADCYSTVQFRKFSTPSFSTYVMTVKSGDLSRADIYIQMPYRNIRFEKTPDVFKGSYSVVFTLRDKNNEIVATKEIDRPIQTMTYDETVSSRYDVHFQSFNLIPNEYKIDIVATDHLSQLRSRHTENIIVKNYSDSVNIASSVLFLNTMLIDEKGISLRPIMPSNVSLLTDSIGMFQEVYNIRMKDTIRITEIYRLQRAEEPSDRSFSYQTPPYRVTINMCERIPDSVSYRKDSVFVADRNGTIRLFQFYPLPFIGGNIMERTVVVKRNGRVDSAQYFQSIYRRSNRSITSLSNEEITSAMRYIVREQEYDSIMTAKSADKNAMFIKFWENRGGRERRTEFERKIAEANALFTTSIEGSRTAMGIVYIVCGMPDYVDCRGTFIETWYYNVGDRAYAVEFRRENEQSANFELSPFSVNEAVWQYFVDLWRRKK